MTTIAFDIYGTLINPHGVVTELQRLVGPTAVDFSICWREKQLEYSFRRGLMQDYVNFETCTRQALEYTIQKYAVEIADSERAKLLALYGELPAFPEVTEALDELSKTGLRLFAFSNGSADTVDNLLKHAGIRQYFQGVISVNEIQSFKPNPETYAYFIRAAEAAPANTWLVSSNPFDVIGAKTAGLHALWIQRDTKTVFDPWSIQPNAVVKSLAEAHDVIKGLSPEESA